MPHDEPTSPHLCFVESRQLEVPMVDRPDVWTLQGQRIGSLDGIVVDAAEQRAWYLVVDRGRYRLNRCLIPLPAQLDIAHQALRVDTGEFDIDELPAFDPRTFPRLPIH